MAGVNSQKPPDDFMGNVAAFAAIYTIFYEIFGGVARYILVNADALFINNIPGILSAFLFGMYFVVAILKNQKIEKFMIIFLAFIAIYAVYALVADLPLAQSAFGFYVWAPFLLGTLICAYEKEKTVFKFMFFFWAITVVGVLVNHFIEFPWAGLSYRVAGIQMVGVRKWYADGYVRLAGFGRASYAAAGIILISYAYMMASHKFSRIFKIIAYFISGLAIFLTTSKIELVLLVAAPPFIFSYRYLKHMAPHSRLAVNWVISVLTFMIIVGVALPVLLDPNAVRQVSGKYLFFDAASMVDRATNMWPGGWKILHDHGNNWLLGRGIGGIGIPIAIDDLRPVNSTADNMFLYIFVSGGIVATIPIFWGLLRNLGALYKQNRKYFEIIVMLTFCIAGLGITENVIEDPTLVIILGFLVARGYTRPKLAEA